MIQYFKEKRIEIRFIEFMDVGNDNGWDFSKVVTKDEMLEMIEKILILKRSSSNTTGSGQIL